MKSLKPIAFFFLIAISFVLNSCSNEPIDPAIDPSANNSSSSGMLRWSCKVDGVLHEWSGSFGASSGLSNYAKDDQNPTDGNPNGQLMLSNNDVIFAFILPTVNTGNFNLNGSSENNAAVLTLSATTSYGTVGGQSISVNITELSNNTAITGDLSGRVKGTFSGSMRQVGSLQTITITEGSFEAIRAQ